MAKEIRTRPVNRDLYINYLKKAEEFYRCLEFSFNVEDWNASVVNAIHSTISSADAMTVFYLGFRHAGGKHMNVLKLLLEMDFDPKEIKSKSRQLSSLLLIKNRAEYEERLMSRSDALNAKKAAKRFKEWVEENLN